MMQSKSEIHIRRECPDDYTQIKALVKEAFASAEHSDGDEHNLISRIRTTGEYVPELSLVAIENDCIIGYAMFSKVLIGNEAAIALAPVAISIKHRMKGVGKSLIETGHEIARSLGYMFCRFGLS